MFGYKITIFKKNKGVKVDPQPKKVHEDSEYVKWKKEKEQKERHERCTHNRNVIKEAIANKVDEEVERFKSKYPQPFEVGEKITYRYYGPHSNPFYIGWHGSPSSLHSTFIAPDLRGPITFPVHKIFAHGQLLEDKLEQNVGYYNLEVKITEIQAKSMVDSAFNKLCNHKDHWCEWVVDFDWKTLKIPSQNCANEEGWLDLRWGGFNAGYFITASSPFAKKQHKLWEKEKVYLEKKAKFESELKELEESFEKAKNNLI